MTDLFRTALGAATVAALALAAPAAFAAGTETTTSTAPAAQSGYAEAKAAVDGGQYAQALKLLAAVLKAEPRNADALNLMGYSNRKMNRFPEAERWYQAALKANPKHLGALEYQGELYVEMGEYAKARANLDRLAALCGTCEEYTDLQTALLSAGQG
ncbi:MAG: tetratricopeptide repeat protein [Rhodobacteraceae bacterium]|nr:tetratricopeptide repeat protein [Paracoccaceae bacterium]